MGYWIARDHWGRGYASEAGRAALEVVRALGHRRVQAGHYVDNPASGRVLRKLGFRDPVSLAGGFNGWAAAGRPVVSTAITGSDPTIMLTGPTPASEKVLAQAGMTTDDIDLFELNEAFASVVMKWMKDLKLPEEKVNVNGGAIAMGHPLGATGAMILGTMVDELERRQERRALLSLCIGGGMGIGTIIERV